MKIFLDTEFTDFLEPHLISLGMVADSGEEFYVELPYPDTKCSPFVREAVIPLLGQYPDAACDAMAFRMWVLNWLQIVRRNDEPVEICLDYQTDWDLFVDAMDYRIPGWCNALHVGRDINELLRYTWHQKNGNPEHHATTPMSIGMLTDLGLRPMKYEAQIHQALPLHDYAGIIPWATLRPTALVGSPVVVMWKPPSEIRACLKQKLRKLPPISVAATSP